MSRSAGETAPEKRGGSGRGQGRKPKAATGELMKTHNVRTTDAQWADFQLVGMDRVRELVSKEARRMRSATE